MILAERQS